VIRLARSFGLRRWITGVLAVWIAVAVAILGGMGAPAASGTEVTVGLASAAAYAVLAGSTVTNTGSSVISGDIGLDPGTSVTGFPPGEIVPGTGTEQVADAEALQAQSDLKKAYNDAATRKPPTAIGAQLGGLTLGPGVYKASSDMGLTGTITLDGDGNVNAVFIFQAGSTLITATHSTVSLIGDAQACNVFWQVGSSATLKGGTNFNGTILALTSATLDTGATVKGRVLARNGAVTLDDNTITRPTVCLTKSGGGSSSSTTASSSTPTTPTSTTPTPVPVSPTGEPWAGWPYWTLAGLAGIFGVASLERAVRIRRRRS
jgi:hypothetical protein